jgi:poly(3-hydroxybutyrate) depolymerase
MGNLVARLSLLALAVAVAAVPSLLRAAPLESVAANVKIDPDQISVSGISSGAFMAHQFHVIHSANVMGMGAVAGGPYYCAEGNVIDAITKCSAFMVLTCADATRHLTGFDCSAGFTGPRTDAEAIAMARASFAEAKAQSGSGIDDVSTLARAKVYLFRGGNDVIVPMNVMGAVRHFYADEDKGGVDPKNVIFNDTFIVRHAMVTDNFYQQPSKLVGRCNTRKPIRGDTFVVDCANEAAAVIQKNDCACTGPACAERTPAVAEICTEAAQIDLAGAILSHIYGELAPRQSLVSHARTGVEVDKALGDLVVAFDQKAVFDRIEPGAAAMSLINASMANKGYIFIPEACQSGATCRLHVAFHGCKQGGETGEKAGYGYSGNIFAKYAGYNEWAKTNNIVVLYPQVREWNTGPVNPQGCWDWWGQFYTHDAYHTKGGLQTRAVAEMINILLGEDRLKVSD